MKNAKKLLALVVAVVMCLALAAPAFADDGDQLAADVYTQANFDQVAHDEESGQIYDEVFGEFNEYYATAKDEIDPDVRLGLMAIAEAKLLETGAVTPAIHNAGNYAISKIIPHTQPGVIWGMDGSYRGYKNLLITDQWLTPDVRTELTTKWGELRGTGTWLDWAKQWAADNGYTLQDSYTLAYTSDPQTWDALASYQASDGEPISMTVEPLLQYDTENVQQPALAESYEVSEDGLTYTFHLREGVKWVTYQGTEVAEVTADDFVAGLQHCADAQINLAGLLFGTIQNLEEYATGEITDFAEVGVKAVDDYTVEYTLAQPAPWFNTLVGYNILYPMNRGYYESQGGKFGEEFDASATDYLYGTDSQHIAYCGPYLVSNYTRQNTITYTANPSYWDADNVQIKTVTFRYDDGTDPTRTWDNLMDGTYNAGAGLGAENLEQAKNTEIPDDPDGATYFEKYAYVNSNGTGSWMNWLNLDRYAYANYNDETQVRSSLTVAQADAARTAMQNQNFRLAFAFAFDRASWNAISRGEDLKYARLINSFVPGNLTSTTKEITLDINGTETTFAAGTYYGEILQAQVDADEFPVQVWDPEGDNGAGSSFGFDGWYNPEEAAKYMDAAVEELAAEGIEISAENPIYLDYPDQDYSTSGAAMDQILKSSVEEALGGRVVINLVPCGSSDNQTYATYYGGTGYTANYDVYLAGNGWSPDYGDPQTYLDTMLDGGSMLVTLGLY